MRRGKLNSQFIVTARIDLSIFTINFKFQSLLHCPCNRGRSPGAVRPYGRTLVQSLHNFVVSGDGGPQQLFYDLLRSPKAGEHSLARFLSRAIIENVAVGLI